MSSSPILLLQSLDWQAAFQIALAKGFPLQRSAQDTARVAAQVVTDGGFLGAGALLHARGHVRGLTTAASIWLVAAIGLAVGTGLYFLAVFTAFLSALLLIFLAPVSRRLESRAPNLTRADRAIPQEEAEQGHTSQRDARFAD